jgi:hypothetical protein
VFHAGLSFFQRSHLFGFLGLQAVGQREKARKNPSRFLEKQNTSAVSKTTLTGLSKEWMELMGGSSLTKGFKQTFFKPVE